MNLLGSNKLKIIDIKLPAIKKLVEKEFDLTDCENRCPLTYNYNNNK